jgi:hypothetical protein
MRFTSWTRALIPSAVLALTLGVSARPAHAQFNSVTINGITANLLSSGGGQSTYSFSLANGATFTNGSGTFDIESIFGVYQVNSGTAVITTRPDWSLSNVNGGSGFETEPGAVTPDAQNKDNIRQGQTKGDFTWSDPQGSFGYHIRWFTDASHTTTDTGFIQAVPEPAFYQMAALLGLGGFGMLRLRRRPKA